LLIVLVGSRYKQIALLISYLSY